MGLTEIEVAWTLSRVKKFYKLWQTYIEGGTPVPDERYSFSFNNVMPSSVTNEPLVVSVSDRSEKGGIVNDIESTVIKESKVSVSTV